MIQEYINFLDKIYLEWDYWYCNLPIDVFIQILRDVGEGVPFNKNKYKNLVLGKSLIEIKLEQFFK